MVNKVMILGLFEKGNDYLIDFQEGSNCLFGDNGTGKTTLINLIVAGLEADLSTLMAVNFDYLSISILDEIGEEREIAIVKGAKDVEENMHEDDFMEGELSTLVISVDGHDYSFDYVVDDAERYARKWGRSRKLHAVKNVLARLINLTHVPLLRMRTEVSSIESDEFDFEAWENEEFTDTSTSVLYEIEKKFKVLAEGYREEDTRKLEGFKSQIIQKFLIDKSALREINHLSKNFGSDYENEEDVEDLLGKLNSAGLEVPRDKLLDNLNLLSELGEESQKHYDLVANLQKTEISEEELSAAQINMSRAIIDTLVSRALFQRFQSVIIDVENLQADRDGLWDLFEEYEETVNKFLNNKSFKVSKSGEFKVYSGIRAVKLKDLSSGEKHILAILGRAALSKEKGSVFIADEPELSLHLTWQRMILPSILRLSPKSQIIVATHSPAIIPKDANKIDLGECV